MEGICPFSSDPCEVIFRHVSNIPLFSLISKYCYSVCKKLVRALVGSDNPPMIEWPKKKRHPDQNGIIFSVGDNSVTITKCKILLKNKQLAYFFCGNNIYVRYETRKKSGLVYISEKECKVYKNVIVTNEFLTPSYKLQLLQVDTTKWKENILSYYNKLILHDWR